jgi:hypothetical protein
MTFRVPLAGKLVATPSTTTIARGSEACHATLTSSPAQADAFDTVSSTDANAARLRTRTSPAFRRGHREPSLISR